MTPERRAEFLAVLGPVLEGLIASGKKPPAHANTMQGMVLAAVDITEAVLLEIDLRWPDGPPVQRTSNPNLVLPIKGRP